MSLVWREVLGTLEHGDQSFQDSLDQMCYMASYTQHMPSTLQYTLCTLCIYSLTTMHTHIISTRLPLHRGSLTSICIMPKLSKALLGNTVPSMHCSTLRY